MKKYIKDGKVFLWPSKVLEKKRILEYLVDKIEPKRIYSERELSELIIAHTTVLDHAFFRRALFDYGFINRTKDGSSYWREE